MFTMLTDRGEPMAWYCTFGAAYSAARSEAMRKKAPVQFVGRGGNVYEVPESGNGWFLIGRAA